MTPEILITLVLIVLALGVCFSALFTLGAIGRYQDSKRELETVQAAVQKRIPANNAESYFIVKVQNGKAKIRKAKRMPKWKN